MKPYSSEDFLLGDCRTVLAELPAESVHCNPEYVEMAQKRLEGITIGMAL
jgi:hypothetical protein